MVIIGIGTDLVQISRVESIFRHFKGRFAERILAPEEHAEFNDKPTALFLAKRFAAKEAASKALGTGMAQGLSFQDFWINHTAAGKPILNISRRISQKTAPTGGLQTHLSITDEGEYVLAFVVLEWADP